MRKSLHILLLGLCGCLAACRQDCYDMPATATYRLRPELLEWVGDSVAVSFDVISSDSFVETWICRNLTRPVVTELTYQCSPHPWRKYETESRGYVFRSSLTDAYQSIYVRPWEDTQKLSIGLDDFYVSYDPLQNTFTGVQSSEGTTFPTGAVLDSLVVQGRVWRDVLFIDAAAGFLTYSKVWFAKGWGIVRYESPGGKVWERLP